jgi:hypothetical protein
MSEDDDEGLEAMRRELDDVPPMFAWGIGMSMFANRKDYEEALAALRADQGGER